MNCAYFLLENGQTAYVPSFINSPESQRHVIETAGLRITDTSTVNVEQVPPPHSMKIMEHGGIVTGMMVVKPKRKGQ